MSDPINLSTYDFDLESKINDEGFNEIYQKFCIHIIDNDNKTAKLIKHQIQKNQDVVQNIRQKIKECEGRIKIYLDYIEKEQKEASDDLTSFTANRHEEQIELYQELIRVEDRETRNFKSLLGDSQK